MSISLLNAVFQNWNTDPLLLNKFYTIDNHSNPPLNANLDNVAESVAAVARLSSKLYLTKPPLVFNIKMTYPTSNPIGTMTFAGRVDELTCYNPLWAKVQSVVFVFFSKHESGTQLFENETTAHALYLTRGWKILAEGSFSAQADYASFPRKCHLIFVGAEQEGFTLQQKAILEEACVPPPTPLLVKLFPYIFG